jgi:GntR family transcriptional regulator
MLLHLTELSSEPMHLQISRQLMDKIISGELAGGAEMVPIRKLARKQHVSIHTVKRAYEEIQREGFIQAKEGEGFFITPMTPEEKESILTQRRLNRSCSG